jgi:hypothetical protein
MRPTPCSDLQAALTVNTISKHIGRWTKPAVGVLLLLLLAGCVTTQTASNVKELDRLDTIDDEKPHILVMPPDIKYYLLTSAGLPRPHAEWTMAARKNFSNALQAYAIEHGTDIELIADEDELSETEIEYQKLYSAVGTSILIHHFGTMPLPTKNRSFDWSLGPGVKKIGEAHDADYALFSYYRDYQASGGRVAFAILAAFAGVGMSMGSEGGFASLVDLKTGEIIWFNKVLRGSGELRQADGARQAVDTLFHDLPEG